MFDEQIRRKTLPMQRQSVQATSFSIALFTLQVIEIIVKEKVIIEESSLSTG